MADRNLTEQSEIVKARMRGWNRFLKWFVLFVFVVAVCKVLFGCTPATAPYPCKVGHVWCRHSAILAASVCGEYYPVQIVVGKTPGGGHAQARCKIEGTWEWLQVRNGEVYVAWRKGRSLPSGGTCRLNRFYS